MSDITNQATADTVNAYIAELQQTTQDTTAIIAQGRDDVIAIVSAASPIAFFADHAEAVSKIATVPVDGIFEIIKDETQADCRTRYFKRAGNVLEFVVNLDALAVRLAEQDGVKHVGGAASTADVAAVDFPKFTRAAEFAKRLTAGESIAVDCFGDSTMFGATTNNVVVQDPNNAPAVFKQTLELLFPVTITVSNRAISGTTMAQMIAGTDGSGSPFADKVEATDAEVIFCNHGINDSQLDGSIDAYRANVIAFVSLCRKYGKCPILVTPNPCPLGGVINEAKAKRLLHYVNVMRDLARSLAVDLVDQYYFYEKTSRLVSMLELVPDGAHPASAAYAMSGRNMAIPFVMASTLYRAGDKTSLARSSFYDNLGPSRAMRTDLNGPFNRLECLLVGTRNASPQGFVMPVILDNPTDDTALAMYGGLWPSGTRSVLTYSGAVGRGEFSGAVNQGAGASADFSAEFLPAACSMYAGLHVVGAISATGNGVGPGEDFAFAGVGLVRRADSMFGIEPSTYTRNLPIFSVGSFVTCVAPISEGVFLEFRSCSTNAVVLSFEFAAGKLSVFRSGVETVIAASGVSAGSYLVKVRLLHDGRISINIGVLGVMLDASVATTPNLYCSTFGAVLSLGRI